MDIRERSGEVDSTDKMVAFFYLLIRDHITPGLMEQVIKQNDLTTIEKTQFSNGWLAEYCKDIVERLTVKSGSKVVTKQDDWVFDKDKIDEHMIELNTEEYFLMSIRDDDRILPEILMDIRQARKVQNALDVLDSFVECAFKVKRKED